MNQYKIRISNSEETSGEQMEKNVLLLVPNCSFSRLFDDRGDNGYPRTLVAYTRSDYDGYRWWNTCNSQVKELNKETCAELDGFHEALLSMKEFKDLDAMTRMCRKSAAPTSEPTEFNLYSETEHHYVWLRLITRRGDYNLYEWFLKK